MWRCFTEQKVQIWKMESFENQVNFRFLYPRPYIVSESNAGIPFSPSLMKQSLPYASHQSTTNPP